VTGSFLQYLFLHMIYRKELKFPKSSTLSSEYCHNIPSLRSSTSAARNCQNKDNG
jgi:hypothetical protein